MELVKWILFLRQWEWFEKIRRGRAYVVYKVFILKGFFGGLKSVQIKVEIVKFWLIFSRWGVYEIVESQLTN
jgi:hypothetical protein